MAMHPSEPVGPSPLHLLQALWKQRARWALLWLLATAAVLAAVWLIPPRYRAEAILVLEPARPPGRASGLPTDSELRARLELVRLKVLRRERLLELLKQAYPKLVEGWAPAQEPERLERLRRRITVGTIPESRSGRFSGVRVAFEGNDPAAGAAVVNRIAAALAQEFRPAAGRAEETSRLSHRVTAAWSRLAECQDALRSFEAEQGGDLEQREKSLVAEQAGLRGEQAALERSLARALQERERLARALAEAERQAARTAPPPAAPAVRSSPNEARQLRDRLAALLARYKEAHPDVRRLRQELAWAEALRGGQGEAPEDSRPDSAAQGRPSPGERETLERLRQELVQAEQKARELAGEKDRLAEALRSLDQRLAELPDLRRRRAALARECELAEQDYRAAASARQQAELEADRRAQDAEPRLVLLEEALAPARPLSPNRRLLGLLGALAALLPCAAAAAGRELDPKTMLACLGLAAPNHNGFGAAGADGSPLNGRGAASAG